MLQHEVLNERRARAGCANVFLAGILCSPSFVVAAVPCPPMPDAITTINRDVKSDINASVGSLGKLKAGEVAAKTEVVSKFLLDKYPNLDKILALQTMSATYCAMLNQSSLSDIDKLERWEKFQDKALSLQTSAPSRPTSPPKEVGPTKNTTQEPPTNRKSTTSVPISGAPKPQPSLTPSPTTVSAQSSPPVAVVRWEEPVSNGINDCNIKGIVDEGLGVVVHIQTRRLSVGLIFTGNNWDFRRYRCSATGAPIEYCEYQKPEVATVAFGARTYELKEGGNSGACDRSLAHCSPESWINFFGNDSDLRAWGLYQSMVIRIGSGKRAGYARTISLREPHQALKAACAPQIVAATFSGFGSK